MNQEPNNPFEDIDLSFPTLSRRPVRKVLTVSNDVFAGIEESVKEKGKILLSNHWTFHVTAQNRGFCRKEDRIITIPQWCLSDWINKEKPGYKVWYLAHEMAHAFHMESAEWNRKQAAHGLEFMEWLIRICPEYYLHHELGYKPRNAAAAGITKHGLTKPLGDLGF